MCGEVIEAPKTSENKLELAQSWDADMTPDNGLSFHTHYICRCFVKKLIGSHGLDAFSTRILHMNYYSLEDIYFFKNF